MRYGAHLKQRTFVAKLSHDGIACFQRDAPLDAEPSGVELYGIANRCPKPTSTTAETSERFPA
jgi:hypothetical protein